MSCKEKGHNNNQDSKESQWRAKLTKTSPREQGYYNSKGLLNANEWSALSSGSPSSIQFSLHKSIESFPCLLRCFTSKSLFEKVFSFSTQSNVSLFSIYTLENESQNDSFLPLHYITEPRTRMRTHITRCHFQTLIQGQDHRIAWKEKKNIGQKEKTGLFESKPSTTHSTVRLNAKAKKSLIHSTFKLCFLLILCQRKERRVSSMSQHAVFRTLSMLI